MLAAGISTHRAIRPVLVSSVIVSLFAVGNQEVIMPVFGEELARRHDDDGLQRVNLRVQPLRLAGHHDPRQGGRSRHADDHAGSTPRSRGRARRDPRDRGQPGDLHPARPSDRAAQGGLAGPRGHDQPAARRRRASWSSGEILSRVDDLEGFPPPLVVPGRVDNRPDAPAAAHVRESRPERAHAPFGNRLSGLAAPLPFALDLGLWRIHVLLDRKLDLGRGTYFLKSSLTFPGDDPQGELVQVRDHARPAREPDGPLDGGNGGAWKWRSSSTVGSSGRSWVWTCSS